MTENLFYNTCIVIGIIFYVFIMLTPLIQMYIYNVRARKMFKTAKVGDVYYIIHKYKNININCVHMVEIIEVGKDSKKVSELYIRHSNGDKYGTWESAKDFFRYYHPLSELEEDSDYTEGMTIIPIK